MISSQNALEYLQDYCEKQGKPVQYVILNGGGLLKADDELRRVEYYNPKRTPELVRIGKATLGSPLHVNARKSFIVWKTR